MKKPRTVSAVTQALAGQVYEHAKEGRLVLTLGGDHSIAIGTIAGTAKAVRERTGRGVGVVWGELWWFLCVWVEGVGEDGSWVSWTWMSWILHQINVVAAMFRDYRANTPPQWTRTPTSTHPKRATAATSTVCPSPS